MNEPSRPGSPQHAAEPAGRTPSPHRAPEPPATSYGEFLADPPYVLADDLEPRPSDAGLPPPVLAPGLDPDAVTTSTMAPTMPTAPEAASAGPHERVTCPECGATQEVHMNRRDATDFCRRCDFPLFWVPNSVTRDRDRGAETEALRRLPGTLGRTTLATAACPSCAELNPVGADVCVRCGVDMHPVAPPPPQAPPLPPPEPMPVLPEPEPSTPWWVWLVIAAAVVLVVVLVLAITGVFG